MSRLILAPFVLAALAVLVSFALSNAQPATLGLWPTGYTIVMPLSVAVLAAMGVAFLCGALMTWFSAVAARGRARTAEDRVRMLTAQLAEANKPAPGRALQPPA